jgi:hypothetical protein
MPFWLPFDKNIVWYTLVLVVLALLVLANIYPNFREGLTFPKQTERADLPQGILVQEANLKTEIKSVSDLESLLEKNVEAVEKVLNLIDKREKRSIEQLDGVAKTTLALDTRIQQLQAEVDDYKKKLSVSEKTKNPFFNNLPILILSLVDGYYRGDVSSIQLIKLQEQSFNQNMDENFKQALQVLIDETTGHGPVLNEELVMLSFQALHQGPPDVEDLLVKSNDKSDYFDQARNYLSKWVEVRKLENLGNKNPWIQGVYDIQNKIAQRKYQDALNAFEKPLLKKDERLNSLKNKVKTAHKQQVALEDFMTAYKKFYESHL